ncbi:hypothetical protein HYU50_04930 [Candidatus Woesearchaeota archaeon]|nr:hypothetical protein [Candidatus Woesearchaeota archaeon]
MLIYWFLPIILLFGIVTSYEDVKFGKIRNKWIILALAYSIAANIVLFSLKYYDADYLTKFLINSLLSLAAGFLIWHLNLWTAGDAKLFFAFTTLMPIYKPYSYFFFISFLSNAFIPISIVFFIYMLFKTTAEKKLFYFKKTFNAKTIFDIILFIFGFLWIIISVFDLIGLRSNILLSLFAVFLMYYFIERILKIKILYISLLMSLLRLIFDSSVYSLEFIGEFAMLALLFLIIRIFLFSMGSGHFAREVKFTELKEGMIPAETIFKSKGKYFKSPVAFSIIGLAKRKNIGKLLFKNSAKGLGKKEIRILQSLQGKSPLNSLKVQTTMPFDPFIFLGAILTIVFHGNFIGALV